MATVNERYAGLAEALIPVVLEAGRAEMHHFRAGVEVRHKADDSPVTVADQEAEAIILAALARLTPDIPVIAEEAVSAGDVPEIGLQFWLVDPLDGTREFISGRGEFTVNVALIENAMPGFGIVYAPALDMLCVTLAPDHAVEATIAPDAPFNGIATLGANRIATRSPDTSALTAVASRSHLDPETEALLANYQVAEKQSAGSSLKFCLVARGLADIYPRLGRTMEWDTAAGQAVLQAAGGAVVNVDHSPFSYGKTAAGYANPGFIAIGHTAALV